MHAPRACPQRKDQTHMPQDIAFAIRRAVKGLLPFSCFDHRKRRPVDCHPFECRA